MSFTSANWLNSLTRSAASATCHVGLHTAAFHHWCFPITRHISDSAYHFSLCGSLLYNGASSARVTSSSGDILKSLLSGQSTITSRILGDWGFHMGLMCDQCDPLPPNSISGMMCREGTLSLKMQPRSLIGKRRCASVPTTSEEARTPSYAARISFSFGL